jgi:hypothetical protein
MLHLMYPNSRLVELIASRHLDQFWSTDRWDSLFRLGQSVNVSLHSQRGLQRLEEALEGTYQLEQEVLWPTI